MSKEKYRAKQHQGKTLGVLLTFRKLLLQRIEKAYPQSPLKNEVENLQTSIKEKERFIWSLEDKEKKLQDNVSYFSSNETAREKRLKGFIIYEAQFANTERMNEKRIAMFVSELGKAREKAKEDLATYKNDLAHVGEQLKMVRSELQTLKGDEKKLSSLLGSSYKEKIPLLEYRTKFNCNHLLHFFRIPDVPLTTRSVKVYENPTDPHAQQWHIMALLTMVPEWDINRLIYFHVICELISEDDYNGTARIYNIGNGREIFGGIDEGKEMWVNQFNENDDALKGFYLSLTEKLDEWLQKPMGFESLITDRFTRFLASKDDTKWSRQMESPFRGGRSLTQQLLEFTLFAKEQLKIEEFV